MSKITTFGSKDRQQETTAHHTNLVALPDLSSAITEQTLAAHPLAKEPAARTAEHRPDLPKLVLSSLEEQTRRSTLAEAKDTRGLCCMISGWDYPAFDFHRTARIRLPWGKEVLFLLNPHSMLAALCCSSPNSSITSACCPCRPCKQAQTSGVSDLANYEMYYLTSTDSWKSNVFKASYESGQHHSDDHQTHYVFEQHARVTFAGQLVCIRDFSSRRSNGSAWM